MSEGTTPLDHRLRWLLRIAAALCFFGHGVFGTLTKAAWVPYFAVVGIPEESAWRLMPQVGAMDMALGVCALLACRPWLWAWMTAWAMWTAVLRPLAGEPIWEAFERAGNYGVPAALLLLARGRSWPQAVTVLRWTSVLLLAGHGMLAWNAKPLLVEHWHAVLPAADAAAIARAAGAVELTLALLLAVEPTGTLGLFACVWKLCTEALFLAAGAPIWEFVERAGSYGAPLVLGLWLARQRSVATLASMLRMLAAALAIASLVPATGFAEEPTASSRGVSRTWSKVAEDDLLRELRAGGLWIVFRHCATDWSQQDHRDLDLSLRENQRNISALGEADARALKEAFAVLGIPHGTAESSPMFRCRETAELAFGAAETTRDLVGRDGAALRRRITQPPPAGTNGICVTHQMTIMGADADVALHEVEEGNCVIYRPGEKPERIAHLAVRDWERLAGLPARDAAGDQVEATAAVAAAEALLAALDEPQRKAVLLPFDASRTAWAATPEPTRVGVVMRELTAAQREQVFDLVGTMLAPAAVRAVRDTMGVERSIVYQRNGAQLGPLEFHVAIHGRPAMTGDWAWRLEGHHVVIMGTVHDGRIVGTTPMFLGAFPATTPEGTRLLTDEQDVSRRLIGSLTEEQRRAAAVADALPMTVMTRNLPRAQPLRPAGIPLRELDAEQAEAVQRLIATFTSRLQPAAATAALDRIRRAGLENVSLGIVVGDDVDDPLYWRLEGPTFIIEFLNSLRDTTHVHTVWRDFERDYGAHAVAAAGPAAVPVGVPGAGAGGNAGPRALPTVAATFVNLDADGDGALTADELQPEVRARLMQADADGDGRILPEELRAARRRAGLPAD